MYTLSEIVPEFYFMKSGARCGENGNARMLILYLGIKKRPVSVFGILRKSRFNGFNFFELFLKKKFFFAIN